MSQGRSAPGPSGGPLVIVLSGPSGVGKDAVLARLKQSALPRAFVVTLTTRRRRPNEKDGVDYRFVSDAEFLGLIEADGLLEHASVYGNRYGVPAKDVNEALGAGLDTLVKVDVQGAATIKKRLPRCVTIFLAPPSREDLDARLRGRQTESAADLALRMTAARGELDAASRFDYVVISRPNEVEQAAENIEAIILAEKCASGDHPPARA